LAATFDGRPLQYSFVESTPGGFATTVATNNPLREIAIVALLGLIGVVLVESISVPQHKAEANGCKNSIAFNASLGRCFHA